MVKYSHKLRNKARIGVKFTQTNLNTRGYHWQKKLTIGKTIGKNLYYALQGLGWVV